MTSVRSAVRLARRMLNPKVLQHCENAASQYLHAPTASCPNCGYQGRFDAAGSTMRFNSACPQCASAERHRLLAIALQRGFVSFAGCDTLHFAPEEAVIRLVTAQQPRSYVTADILDGRAQRVLNIEALDLPDASFDRIVCSHVLEHVDDRRALAELHRVLRPGGRAVLMVPLVEGWATTYENPEVTTEEGRRRHYGQGDHVRYYGGDFRQRVRDAGFALAEFTAEGADVPAHHLTPGEKVFLASKP